MRRYKSSDYLDMLLQIAPERRMVPDQPPQGFPACAMSFGSIRARKKLTIRLTGVLGLQRIFRSCKRPTRRRRNDLYSCPNQFSQSIRSISNSLAAQPGLPRGPQLTHRNVVNNGFFVGERMKTHS